MSSLGVYNFSVVTLGGILDKPNTIRTWVLERLRDQKSGKRQISNIFYI